MPSFRKQFDISWSSETFVRFNAAEWSRSFCCLPTGRPGTDVMIKKKYFRRKMWQKIGTFYAQNKAKLCKN
jgi:hypothetical protein